MDTKGLQLDNTFENKEELGFAWAKNIMYEQGFKEITNEKSFKVEAYSYVSPNGTGNTISLQSVCGIIPINDTKDKYILLTGNNAKTYTDNPLAGFTQGISEIGMVENGTYTLLTRSANNAAQQLGDYFHFDPKNPIQGVYKYNYKGELIIAWIESGDDAAPPRVLNLGKLPYLHGATAVRTMFWWSIDEEQEMVIQLALPRNYFRIDIADALTNTEWIDQTFNYGISGGGALYAGTYQFLCVSHYEQKISDKIYGNRASNFTQVSACIPIQDCNDIGLAHEPDDNLGKAISLRFNCLNSQIMPFYITIYAVHKIAGIVRIYECDTIPVTTMNAYYTYTGKNKGEINPAEVLTENMEFTSAGAITVNKDCLVLGDLETKEEYNYQRYANNITCQWQSVDNVGGSMINSHTVFKLKGVVPDEVYALYAHLIYKDGKVGKGFHIPGRIVGNYDGQSELLLISDAAALALPNSPTYVGERRINPNARIYQTRDTADTAGNMGYWQNMHETYPNSDDFDVWGLYQAIAPFNPLLVGTYVNLSDPALVGDGNYRPTLKLQNVRHHKTPSERTVYGTGIVGGAVGTDKGTYTINLILNNIVIPPELVDQIDGITFSYAKRTIENKLTLGFSPLLQNNFYLPFNNPALLATRLNVNEYRNFKYLRLYDPYLNAKLTKEEAPSIKVDYVKGSYRVINTTPVFFNMNDLTTVATPMCNDNLIIPIRFNKYIPENNLAVDDIHTGYESPAGTLVAGTLLGNGCREACMLARIEDADSPTDPIYYIPGAPPLAGKITTGAVAANNYNTIIGYLRAYKEDVFTKFYDQELVLTNTLLIITAAGITNNVKLYGLDAFHDIYGCGGGSAQSGISIVTDTTANSIIDSNDGFQQARFRVRGQYNSRCFNYTREDSVFVVNDRTIYTYDDTFSAVNELKTLEAYNPYKDYINEFPQHIYKSDKTGDESLDIAWRNIKANNYKIMLANKGRVTSLKDMNKSLIVHQEYSLFVANIKDLLQANNITAYLGEGDIFDRDPEEVLSTEFGELGNKSKLATFTFVGGYFFVDRVKGICAIYNGELDIISNKYVYEWFKTNINTTVDYDNPLGGMGLTATYEDTYKRIILTKRDGTLWLTQAIRASGATAVLVTGNMLANVQYVICYSHPSTNGSSLNIVDTTNAVNLAYQVTGSACFIYTPKANVATITITYNGTHDLDSIVTFYTATYKTLSYSTVHKHWVALHDYNPVLLFNTRNSAFAACNDTLVATSTTKNRTYKINGNTNYGNFFNINVKNKSYVDIIFNTPVDIEKIVESVSWRTDLFSGNQLLYNKTFSHIMLYNDTQCTEVIPLNIGVDWWDADSGRTTSGDWYFNGIMDAVVNNLIAFLDNDKELIVTNVSNNLKDFFDLSEFICKFVVVRLIIDNVNDYKIKLNSVSVKQRKQHR